MTSIQAVTATHNCKFPNCTNEASSPVGRYAYCKTHQGAAKPKAVAAPDTSIAGKLGALQAQAKKVDKLRAKAEKLTRSALAAKREADEEQMYFERLLSELGGNGRVAA